MQPSVSVHIGRKIIGRTTRHLSGNHNDPPLKVDISVKLIEEIVSLKTNPLRLHVPPLR